MKIEGWGNGGAVEIQGLAASKFLPRLSQDELLSCVRYADTLPETHAGSGSEPGGFEVGVECGWCGWIEARF
jgi:hypothetical protein